MRLKQLVLPASHYTRPYLYLGRLKPQTLKTIVGDITIPKPRFPLRSIFSVERPCSSLRPRYKRRAKSMKASSYVQGTLLPAQLVVMPTMLAENHFPVSTTNGNSADYQSKEHSQIMIFTTFPALQLSS